MKKILITLLIFCQFPFFIEALDDSDVFEEAIETLDKLDEIEEADEFEEAIELDKLNKLDEIDVSITKVSDFTDILAKPLKAELDTISLQKEIDETIESKNFYEIEYDDLFFEIGILYILYNKYTPQSNIWNRYRI